MIIFAAKLSWQNAYLAGLLFDKRLKPNNLIL